MATRHNEAFTVLKSTTPARAEGDRFAAGIMVGTVAALFGCLLGLLLAR